jgi:hypothetical protein
LLARRQSRIVRFHHARRNLHLRLTTTSGQRKKMPLNARSTPRRQS